MFLFIYESSHTTAQKSPATNDDDGTSAMLLNVEEDYLARSPPVQAADF